MNKLYKALDLYELSTRNDKMKSYSAHTNENELQYKVVAYIIQSEQEKKNLLSLYSDVLGTDAVKRILTHKYMVGLLSDKGFIEGTLIFGNTKTVLEDFNKKITSPRYSQYFSSSVSSLVDVDTSFESEGNFDIELPTTKVVKNEDKRYLQFKLDDLIGNVSNSRVFLTSISLNTSKDRIKNMSGVSESLSVLEHELDTKGVNTPKDVLDDILQLSFSKALGLQEKAVKIKKLQMGV